MWKRGNVSVLVCKDVINIAECSCPLCGKFRSVLKFKSEKSCAVFAFPKISAFGGQQEHSDNPINKIVYVDIGL